VILGRVSSWERMALLATSTAFVIPSRKEGFGLNAVHARILSKPTVATLTGAHAQILGAEAPYWLVESGDIPRMTEALRAALRRGPSNVAIDAKQLARFDIRSVAHELLSLLPGGA